MFIMLVPGNEERDSALEKLQNTERGYIEDKWHEQRVGRGERKSLNATGRGRAAGCCKDEQSCSSSRYTIS